MRPRLLCRLAAYLTATTLAAWVAAAASGRPGVPVLRQRLDTILSSGYQLTEPPQARLHEMIVRGLRALRGMLGQFSEVEPLAGLPLWVRPVLTGVLLVLLALMIAHIVASLRGLLGGAADRRPQLETARERRDPADVMRRAEEAFERGERDAALRLLYLAVLLRLDRLGLLAHNPARTNWENLRALTGLGHDAREAMVRLTREVDAAVYGGRRASQDTWEQARRWADALWRSERSA